MEAPDRSPPIGHRTSGPAPTERRERTRRAILTAAFALIGRENGLSTRIEEVCVDAAISRGSFYNYFSGMEELFATISQRVPHSFVGTVMTEMGRLETAAERCDHGLRRFLEKARTDTPWGWAIVNVGAMGPLFGEDMAAMAERTVGDGVSAGDLSIADAGVGSDLLLGAMHAAILGHLRRGSDDDMPRIVSRAVLAGLGVSPDRIETIVARRQPPA